MDDARSIVDPSRRLFLTGLGTLLVTSLGLASTSSEAARPRHPVSNNSLLRDFRTPYRLPYMNTLAVEIERYIKNLRRAGRIKSNERTAWLIYDFTTRQYLVAINATHSYQSASMIKPFIALAFFHKVREGRLRYTPSHRARMEAMIQRSDNHATNYFIELLNRTSRRSGPAEAERTLKRYHPDIFRHTRIVEHIPGGGRTYRNKASALDYHRFLYALWYNRLPYSAELKRLMHLPNRDRIYSDAHGVARQTWVIDKTGTTARLCGDMGILIAQGRNGYRYPYTFIGIIERSRPTGSYRAWKDDRGDVIREVSSLAYSHLRRMHNLV
ncbi:MAG: serine hydrolase [Gammaproteobacteria bacterium]|nr:serine hydrolase [Gammaproteobacteria bacterium]MCP5196858.1 serine hydrolase [Gammaproteobacteria bacterium]